MSGKLKAVAVLAVMYVFGVVSGVAWQSYHGHRWEPMHAMFAERRVKRLSSKLHLSPMQEQALRDIFEKAHEKATQINEEVSWDLEDVHRESVESIRKILNPEQLAEFNKMHSRYHEKHPHMPNEDLESTSTTKATS